MAMTNTPASSAAAMQEYQGPPKQKARYHYDDVRSGFIELAPGPASALTPDLFGQLLRAVEGVDRVELHPNGFFVYSHLAPQLGMEFELTSNRHSKNPNDPYTITAVLKHQKDAAAMLEA